MVSRMVGVNGALALLIGAASGMAISAPRQHFSIDFDQGQRISPSASNTSVDARRGMMFGATIDRGTKAAQRPQIASQGCNTPPGCLRIALDPSAEGAAKNKIMYSFWSHYKPLPGGERGRMRIGDNGVTHIRFAMKLDEDYDTPLHQMVHFQIYQPVVKGGKNKTDVVPGGPILSLRMVPASRRDPMSLNEQEFIVVVRSPQAKNLYYYDKRDKGVLHRGKIGKNKWYTFSFLLRSISRRGRMEGNVGFWINNQRIFDRAVTWGFNPADYTVSSALGFELGSYRSPDKTGHQAVFFDDVSISRTERRLQ